MFLVFDIMAFIALPLLVRTSWVLVAEAAIVSFQLFQLIHYSLGYGKIARRALQSLDKLADEARAAVSDPLHARLTVEGGSETAETAAAVNELLDSAAEIYSSYGQHARFVSDVSHELRTPIAVIQGYANMLARWGKDDPDTLSESIAALIKEANGMQSLVEQLLFLSRGDSGNIRFETRPVDARGLLSELCAEHAMIDDEHRYALTQGDPVTVNADAGLLKQALRALVDNSRKYTPRGGEITLSCREVEETVRLSVEDTGIGIPADDVPRVFDRFFRSDASRARKTGGSGLGLSIAKWIVDRHGGTIEVLSRMGAGTRITFVLREQLPPPSDSL